MAESVRFQGMMNPSSSFLGCKSPSQFSPFVGLEYDERLFEDLIYWGDMKRTVNESLFVKEEVRGGPLKMILMDGLSMDF